MLPCHAVALKTSVDVHTADVGASIHQGEHHQGPDVKFGDGIIDGKNIILVDDITADKIEKQLTAHTICGGTWPQDTICSDLSANTANS